MLPNLRLRAFLVPLAFVLLVSGVGRGQPPTSQGPDKGTMMLTVFLRHDQSKTLGEIRKELDASGFFQKFPPAGVEVVSWYVMMGIGQVVTLRVPADKLRAVNRVIEQSAWGGYRTGFYPTYDFRPVWDATEHHRP